MATVTPPVQSWNRAETQRRVSHPLQRLRGYIRLYLAVEGLALTTLYLALWFWIGLLLDYGLFKAFGIDWVQVLPHTFRLVMLCLLTAGLVAVVVGKVLLRIFREFRDGPLALVLERRFPRMLGDRLITAVEMADPRLAVRYGFSQAMIDQTIRDAAANVEQLPVSEVFNWKRLWRYGQAVVVLTVGPYLAAALGYCLVTGTTDVMRFVRQFNDVATIWFERNILLIDTIWPRRAHLELVGFPGDELKIGRDAPPPALRVRALRWVIGDKNRKSAPEGWRALMWPDVKPGLLGAPVPTDRLPAGWQDKSLDWIDLQLDKDEVRGTLPADQLEAMREVMEHLEAQAARPEMSRRLRKLELPGEVIIYYKGVNVSSEQTLQKESDNEYSVTLTDLKETVRFTIRGEDYYTPYKQITVVPPPMLVELTRDDAQPAYLYQRIPLGGQAQDLRGKKQKFYGRLISLAGDTSRLDVPSGSDIVLTAKTDKAIAVGGVRILPPRKGVAEINVAIEPVDAHTFRTRFANITRTLDFIFEFTDTDNVLGRRRVIIKPSEDAPPDVDVQVEVIRKTNQGYMCTPLAEVPFSGKVRDDWGLANVEYAYTLTRLESQTNATARAARAATTITMAAGGLGQKLLAFQMLAALAGSGSEEDKTVKKAPVETFAQVLKEKAFSDVTLEKLGECLEQPPPEKAPVKDHILDPAAESFKVAPLGLMVKDERTFQPRYRLRLWVAATDSNVETGPGTGESKEKFTLLVVSENELLAEIAKEEEVLHVKLEEALNRLKDSQVKLDKVKAELPELKPDEFSPMRRRAEEIEEALTKSWDSTREVYADYERIRKELLTNQVKSAIFPKVADQICAPLSRIIEMEIGEFAGAEKAIRGFKDTLAREARDSEAADQARAQLTQLVNRLQSVLDSMGEIITINKLIEQLVKIKNAEEEEYQRLLKLKNEKEKILLDQLLPPAPKK